MARVGHMKWVDAIEQVLQEAKHPLHSNEISARAIAQGIAKSDAMLPDHTVQAAVHKHIKEGNTKGFIMIGSGRFHRRYWLQRKGNP
jgi:hypothetical protein